MTGYTVTTNNQYSTDGTWNYTYNNEGAITQKTNISTGELWLYTWDHNNRLIKAEHKASSGGAVDIRVEFVYDALGNRVERSYDADGDGSGSATIEKYAFDPAGNPWADLDSSGSLTTRRLFADAVDALFARVSAAGSVDWLLDDRLGSIHDILNSSGSSIDHVDYTSWGKTSYESSPSNGDRFTFAGFDLDPVIGIALNGARWYSFDIGRWWSEDPIGFDGGQMNLSVYVGNSPVNATDSSGLWSFRREPIPTRPGFYHLYAVESNWNFTRLAEERYIGILDEGNGTVDNGNRRANLSSIDIQGWQDRWSTWFHDNGWEIRPEPLGARPDSGILLDVDHVRRADLAGPMARGLSTQVAVSVILSAVTNGLPLPQRMRMANVRRVGRAGEAAAGIVRNTQRIPSVTGTARFRVPDGLTATTLTEVKNVAELDFSSQIADFLYHSMVNNLDYVIIVRHSTRLSPPLLRLEQAGWVTILRRLP
ncbi:MAG: RHS repeat-associated core domain-containing protein [Gemmataceae bacterium]